jgi:hypothetical protein
MAPTKKTVERMKTIPATITTQAAAMYSLGGFGRSGCGGGTGGGGGVAVGAAWGVGSGVSVMPCILPWLRWS